MTETTSISPEDAASARALEQARLRKERREAKIRAGGASRLNKISGVGGGIPRDPPPAPPSTEIPSTTPSVPAAATKATPRPQAHADPEEVDISQHFYTPQTTQRIPRPSPGPGPGSGLGPAGNMSDAQLHQLTLGLDQLPAANATSPDEDPMMNMLMQMLGGGGAGAGGLPFPPPGSGTGGANDASPFANLANLAGGQPGAAAAIVPDRYTSLWRLLHTAVALGLGLYIALWTSFSGTKAERERERDYADAGGGGGSAEMAEPARRFFYAFATAEAVLLTTRYFMDRGRQQSAAGTGVLGALIGFLPPPLKGYVEIGMRYAQIFGTVRSDVLVCIFVLGVCSWFRS